MPFHATRRYCAAILAVMVPAFLTGARSVAAATHHQAGTEKVLWSFGQSKKDGSAPFGGLLAGQHGALFGITYRGGRSGAGTVFEVTHHRSTYAERVLWSFGSGTDGAQPAGGLIADASGALYGVTHVGGLYNWGAVYKLTPSGSADIESLLYSFCPDASVCNDGALPGGTLAVDPHGVLYGTLAYQSFPRAINNKRVIAGSFLDNTGWHGFTVSDLAKPDYRSVDDPDGVAGTTILSGINDAGQLVGTYADATGIQHGFLATPR